MKNLFWKIFAVLVILLWITTLFMWYYVATTPPRYIKSNTLVIDTKENRIYNPHTKKWQVWKDYLDEPRRDESDEFSNEESGTGQRSSDPVSADHRYQEMLDEIFGPNMRNADTVSADERRRRKALLDEVFGPNMRNADERRRRKELLERVLGTGKQRTERAEPIEEEEAF